MNTGCKDLTYEASGSIFGRLQPRMTSSLGVWMFMESVGWTPRGPAAQGLGSSLEFGTWGVGWDPELNTQDLLRGSKYN